MANVKARLHATNQHTTPDQPIAEPSLAAIEAGQAQIHDHLEYFSRKFASVCQQIAKTPRLPLDDFQKLYRGNLHSHGRHFVIHQHDHPIAGVHYDLRLQFSETSTISFAIPYGLPGNPDSLRPNRMAIETRVHNLWNNLIESASQSTGSLLIWDTGEYEVLPRREPTAKITDDELSDDPEQTTTAQSTTTYSEMLFAAFGRRHIRLRLHGTRLPQNYTIALRLPSGNDSFGQLRKPPTKRRRVDPTKAAKSTKRKAALVQNGTTDDEDSSEAQGTAIASAPEDDNNTAVASDGEEGMESIRAVNAYPGATNDIGSIHQRHWFLTLDKKNSGLWKGEDGRWKGDWMPFFVRGKDVERSIVTGRLADDVMRDEGVEKFVGRKMWRPILE